MATKSAAGLEPIDRLEEKIKTLVSLIGRLKNEQARVERRERRVCSATSRRSRRAWPTPKAAPPRPWRCAKSGISSRPASPRCCSSWMVSTSEWAPLAVEAADRPSPGGAVSTLG